MRRHPQPSYGLFPRVIADIEGALHSLDDVATETDEPGRLEPGVNAIEIATRFIEALRAYESGLTRAQSHPLLPPGMNTINVGVIRGGAGLGNDGLPIIMSNPAIIPDTVAIDLDMKFLPNETSAAYRRDFESFVHHFAQTDAWLRDHPPTVQWELGGLHFQPMNTPLDHPLVTSLVKRKTAIGKAPQVRGFIAVTDAAHYAGAGVNAVIFGASGDGFHGDDEYVDVASLVETTKVLAATVLDYCAVR